MSTVKLAALRCQDAVILPNFIQIHLNCLRSQNGADAKKDPTTSHNLVRVSVHYQQRQESDQMQPTTEPDRTDRQTESGVIKHRSSSSSSSSQEMNPIWSAFHVSTHTHEQTTHDDVAIKPPGTTPGRGGGMEARVGRCQETQEDKTGLLRSHCTPATDDVKICKTGGRSAVTEGPRDA